MIYVRERAAQCILLFLLLLLLVYAELWGLQLHDHFSFWAAAKAYISGVNPYDLDAVRENVLTCCKGVYPNSIERVWGLPVILPLISWFGLLSFEHYLIVHSFVAALLLSLSLYVLLVLYIKETRLSFVLETLLFLSFFPMYVTLVVGPAIMYVLLGLVLFLYMLKRERKLSNTFPGGLALSLCLIKPHVLFLLMCLIFFFSIVRKEWHTFFGVVTGFLILSLIAFFISPSIFAYYLEIFREFPVNLYNTPTIAHFLQQYKALPAAIRFLPALLSFLGLGFLIYQNRCVAMSAEQEGKILFFAIAASIVCAPYLWVYDFLPLLVVLAFLFSKESFQTPLRALLFIAAHVLLWLVSMPMHYSVWYPILLLVFVCKLKPFTVSKTSKSLAGPV